MKRLKSILATYPEPVAQGGKGPAKREGAGTVRIAEPMYGDEIREGLAAHDRALFVNN